MSEKTNNSNNSNNSNYNKVSYELIATSDEFVFGYINPFKKVNKVSFCCNVGHD